jgi:hypothetical protein
MAQCRYCKEDAGFLKSKHTECEKKHNEGCRTLTSLLLHAFRNHTDFYLLDGQIKTIISSNYIPEETKQRIYSEVFDKAVEEYLNDGIISDEESTTVARFQQYTALPQQMLNANRSLERVVQAKILQQLFSGQPLTSSISINGTLPFLFQKNETPIWVYRNVQYYEQKIKKEYRGRSQGVSFRVMKGVYYRVGSFKGTPMETIHNVHIGTGIVGLTEKHLYFSCPQKSFKIPFSKLIHIEPFSDGLGLQKDGVLARPIFLKGMDSWFAYNFIVNINQQ